MRIKRHKQVRRTLKFYQVNFGFREPFKVLVDGNFIHAIVAAGATDVHQFLSKLLMAEVRPFTTRHVIHELDALGSAYRETLRVARTLEKHKCDHPPVESGAESIKHVVGSGNAAHFFVATQDRQLQDFLARAPGGAVPVIFKGVNGAQLQQPAAGLYKKVGRASESRMGVQAHERPAMASGEDAMGTTREAGPRRVKRAKVSPTPMRTIASRARIDRPPCRRLVGKGMPTSISAVA